MKLAVSVLCIQCQVVWFKNIMDGWRGLWITTDWNSSDFFINNMNSFNDSILSLSCQKFCPLQCGCLAPFIGEWGRPTLSCSPTTAYLNSTRVKADASSWRKMVKEGRPSFYDSGMNHLACNLQLWCNQFRAAWAAWMRTRSFNASHGFLTYPFFFIHLLRILHGFCKNGNCPFSLMIISLIWQCYIFKLSTKQHFRFWDLRGALFFLFSFHCCIHHLLFLLFSNF